MLIKELSIVFFAVATVVFLMIVTVSVLFRRLRGRERKQ
jgi:hypothetical protein